MTRLSGTLAARPAANTVTDTLYHATDSGVIYQSAGNQWIVRPKQPVTFFVGISSAASVSALPSAAGNLGWVFETSDTGKLYEGFPGGWVDVSDLVEGLGTSHADLVIQSFSNAAVTVTGGANRIIQTGTMTAPRTATLAPASDYAEGDIVIVTDHSGSVTETNKIVISANGSDTINGTGDDVEILTANGDYALMSNGVDGWETVTLGGGSGASTAADVSFDNAASDLVADTVQGAIDEVEARIDDLESAPGGNVSDPNVAYIRSDGNDTTGDGSPSAPYLTIAKAITEGYKTWNLGVGTFAGGTTSLTGEFSIVGAGENKTIITALTFSVWDAGNHLTCRGVTIQTLTLPTNLFQLSYVVATSVVCVHGSQVTSSHCRFHSFDGGGADGSNGANGSALGENGATGGAATAAASASFYYCVVATTTNLEGGNGGRGGDGGSGDGETSGGNGGDGGAAADGGAFYAAFSHFGNVSLGSGGNGLGGDGSVSGYTPGVGGNTGAGANGGNATVINSFFTSLSSPGTAADGVITSYNSNFGSCFPAPTVGGYNVIADVPS